MLLLISRHFSITGFGYADVENHIPCQSNDTVLRIASITKSMTMAVVAK